MFWSLCYLAFRCVLETIALQRLYLLFFIEIGSRPVHLAGCTANPTGTWVTQQARQFTWTLQEQPGSFRCLIRDRDSPRSAVTFVAQSQRPTEYLNPTPWTNPSRS